MWELTFIAHEVLLDKKDYIKGARKESNIHDDENHNINPDEDDVHVDEDGISDDYDDTDLDEYDKES